MEADFCVEAVQEAMANHGRPYEDVFIKAYGSVIEARRGIGGWLAFYNETSGRIRRLATGHRVRFSPGSPWRAQHIKKTK